MSRWIGLQSAFLIIAAQQGEEVIENEIQYISRAQHRTRPLIFIGHRGLCSALNFINSSLLPSYMYAVIYHV
jgi:hypothetical protein